MASKKSGARAPLKKSAVNRRMRSSGSLLGSGQAPVKKAADKSPVKKVAAKLPPPLTRPRVTPPRSRVRADDPLSLQRVEYLTEVFSRAELARLVGVSASQTSRWVSGEEQPGPAAAAALIDLEHVLARARLVWGGESARIWMESANSFLSGARPVDVLRTQGAARVLDALDAEMWGGAA